MRYRVMVEIKYLFALMNHSSFKKIKPLSKKSLSSLEGLYQNFSNKEFKQIKKIEEKTKHDVNAVVVFISKKLKQIDRKDLMPLVHFGLTSEAVSYTHLTLPTSDLV